MLKITRVQIETCAGGRRGRGRGRFGRLDWSGSYSRSGHRLTAATAEPGLFRKKSTAIVAEHIIP